jgi:chemotaxis protein CheC
VSAAAFGATPGGVGAAPGPGGAPLLDGDHEEVLREVVNVAMGTAGAALATALDRFVQLSVPRIHVVSGGGGSVPPGVKGPYPDWRVSAVRQAFYGHLAGEVVTLFGSGDGEPGVAGALGRAGSASERELLLDVSNAMAGACVNGIAQQLQAELDYAAPSMLCENDSFDGLLSGQISRWSFGLLIEVDFRLEESAFASGLLIFLSNDTVGRLRDAMAALLEGGPLA